MMVLNLSIECSGSFAGGISLALEATEGAFLLMRLCSGHVFFVLWRPQSAGGSIVNA